MQLVTVPVQPASQSVTAWAQAIGLVVSIAAYFGLDLSGVDIGAIILGVQGIVAVITLIRKKWFTKSVTPAVAAKL